MIIAQITISCDACYEEYDGADTSASLIREAAKADGWKVAITGGRDLCAACMARGNAPDVFWIRRGLIAPLAG